MRDVFEMAKEAGFMQHLGVICIPNHLALERFAELVRADERRAMMQLFTDPENQPTQHDTVTVEYMKREIADEREECAKVCDGLADMHAKMNQWGSHKTADTLAQAIRARSNT
jgi:hypothetical protein